MHTVAKILEKEIRHHEHCLSRAMERTGATPEEIESLREKIRVKRYLLEMFCGKEDVNA